MLTSSFPSSKISKQTHYIICRNERRSMASVGQPTTWTISLSFLALLHHHRMSRKRSMILDESSRLTLGRTLEYGEHAVQLGLQGAGSAKSVRPLAKTDSPQIRHSPKGMPKIILPPISISKRGSSDSWMM